LDFRVCDHRWVELADETELLAVHEYRGAAAGMEERSRRAHICARGGRQRVDAFGKDRLQLVKGLAPRLGRVSGSGDRSDAERLVWLALLIPDPGQERAGDLVDLDAVLAPIAVESNGVDEGRQQRRAQRVHVVAERIRHV